MAKLLDFAKPHVLRDEVEYTTATTEIDRLLDLDPHAGSEEYERLEFLSVLVQAYEDTHFPLRKGTIPQDAVEFMLEQKGLSRIDLAEWLGSERQTSEFLHGDRSLSIQQIHAIREKLGIPADLLIGPASCPP